VLNATLDSILKVFVCAYEKTVIIYILMACTLVGMKGVNGVEMECFVSVHSAIDTDHRGKCCQDYLCH
jgi:hypothetical protein